MRILLWTNSPTTNTGYANQAKQLIPYLSKQHELAIIANYGLTGGAINYNGITIFPRKAERQNADVIGSYIKQFEADIVISLYDIWALPHNTKKMLGVPWVAMVPVDGAPVSTPMKHQLNGVDYLVSYSRFAEQEFLKAGYESTYIPHTFDPNIFGPGDKENARKRLGISSDKFLVTTVAANKGLPPRKSWPELLSAYKNFYDNHPDALLYAHTTKKPLGSDGEGIYFDNLTEVLGLPKQSIAYPDSDGYNLGISDEKMALVYLASDVLLLPSRGEGFGLPILEAQACGTPVITTDCSAMTELTQNGYCLESLQKQYVAKLGYFWQIPSIERIENALGQVYDWTEAERKTKQAIGYGFTDDYKIDNVWEKYWEPFLEKVEATLW